MNGMARSLSVYFDDIHVGRLTQDDGGRLQFSYDVAYLVRERAIPVSLSMPLSDNLYGDAVVRPFFSNLLPDDLARHHLARYLGVSEKNPFALLEIIGGDCAGALSLYPEGETPPSFTKYDDEPLNEKRLATILRLLSQRPLLAGEQDVRMSLAGAQDKLAVVLTNGQIALPKGSTPTTHILKTPVKTVKDSVFNEYFCMTLAKRFKIPAASADIRWASDIPYLLLERYDRTPDHLNRLHQEDFCQALGIPPELKYENEGGPSLKKCLALIEVNSLRPAVDTLNFLRLVIFNYCIGNADAHGKNFSFLYQKLTPILAPAYDLLSTSIYPQLSPKMAMQIGGKAIPEHVYLRHWHQLVPETQLAKQTLDRTLSHYAQELPQASMRLLTELASTPLHSPVYAQIHALIENRCRHIEAYFSA
jgi:serine/threonine-protein kinase HipA